MNQVTRPPVPSQGAGGVPATPAVQPEGKPSRSLAKTVRFHVIVLALTFFVTYELFPGLTKFVVFGLVLQNFWYTVPIGLIGIAAIRFYMRNKKDVHKGDLGKHRRFLSLLAFGSAVTVIWGGLVWATTDYLAYYTFANTAQSREGLVPTDPAFVRFTPFANACNDISHSISTTSEEVDCKYVTPIVTPEGFGYASTISPSGNLNVFLKNNPGFMLLDDSTGAHIDPQKRLTRIDEVQYYGQGMQWFDDLDYVLSKHDFFATYEKPHLLALDPGNARKLTLVVSKIKFAYFWRLPYWAGVVLVHADGRLEDLSAEVAVKDPRLKGQWIYPVSLTRHYIELQNYGTGWGIITPYARVQGKLEIEDLTSGNQFPFLTRGADGVTYLVTATKGQGSARGLQRIYFTNATTGAMTFHQFGAHEVLYGPGAVLERITNIPGYQWYHEGEKGGGTMVAIEPVYLVRPHDKVLYWKYTITNRAYSGISATAVTEAGRPDNIRVFTNREAFEEWLRGKDVPPVGASTAVSGLGTKAEILKVLEDLRKRVEQLP